MLSDNQSIWRPCQLRTKKLERHFPASACKLGRSLAHSPRDTENKRKLALAG